MDRGARIWAVTLVLTFGAILVVVALWAFAISAWRETVGAGAYVIVVAIALALAVGIGRVIRWLAQG